MTVATGEPPEAIEARYDGGGYGQFKSDVAEAVVELLDADPGALHGAARRPGRAARLLALGAGEGARGVGADARRDVRAHGLRSRVAPLRRAAQPRRRAGHHPTGGGVCSGWRSTSCRDPGSSSQGHWSSSVVLRADRDGERGNARRVRASGRGRASIVRHAGRLQLAAAAADASGRADRATVLGRPCGRGSNRRATGRGASTSRPRSSCRATKVVLAIAPRAVELAAFQSARRPVSGFPRCGSKPARRTSPRSRAPSAAPSASTRDSPSAWRSPGARRAFRWRSGSTVRRPRCDGSCRSAAARAPPRRGLRLRLC